jgi:hypothetical protein
MPLMKKSKAMESEEPKEKSLAIAYGMKKKAKKYADGGIVDSVQKALAPDFYAAEKQKQQSQQTPPPAYPMDMKAEGGDVHDEDMVDRILRKCMSEGGMVANEQGEQADSMPNEFDDLALRDDLEFHDTGADSGDDHGSKLNQEEDRFDRMLKKRSMK